MTMATIDRTKTNTAVIYICFANECSFILTKLFKSPRLTKVFFVSIKILDKSNLTLN